MAHLALGWGCASAVDENVEAVPIIGFGLAVRGAGIGGTLAGVLLWPALVCVVLGALFQLRLGVPAEEVGCADVEEFRSMCVYRTKTTGVIYIEARVVVNGGSIIVCVAQVNI